MKTYQVWTDSGNWNFKASEETLENLKTTYCNFHYEEIDDCIDKYGDEDSWEAE